MAKVLFYKPYKAVVRNACQSRTIFARWFLRVGKRILAVVHNDSTKKLTTGLFWNIYIYIYVYVVHHGRSKFPTNSGKMVKYAQDLNTP